MSSFGGVWLRASFNSVLVFHKTIETERNKSFFFVQEEEKMIKTLKRHRIRGIVLFGLSGQFTTGVVFGESKLDSGGNYRILLPLKRTPS